MNKQEAIKRVIRKKIEDKELYAIYDDIIKIINEIDKPQKVKIPKYVAEWIERQKKSFSNTSAIDMYSNLKSDNSNYCYQDVGVWVSNHHLEFIKAWHEGYEIVKKLYKVKIPNHKSNNSEDTFALRRVYDHTEISKVNSRTYNESVICQLTEEEIREDFEWAWQFAEEVTE